MSNARLIPFEDLSLVTILPIMHVRYLSDYAVNYLAIERKRPMQTSDGDKNYSRCPRLLILNSKRSLHRIALLVRIARIGYFKCSAFTVTAPPHRLIGFPYKLFKTWRRTILTLLKTEEFEIISRSMSTFVSRKKSILSRLRTSHNLRGIAQDHVTKSTGFLNMCSHNVVSTGCNKSPLCILCYFKMNDVIDNPADCEVRSMIRFLNARHLKSAEIYRQLKEVYGDTVMNERNVRKWCEMFNNGRTNVHDETRPGRPSLITEDLKTKVNDKILQDRRTSLDELHIAFPDISRSLLGEIVSQHLGYHKICARPHTAASTRELLDQFGWEIFDHPPYSPDLAPSDFHLFTKLKDFLGGTRFGSDEELKKTVNTWLNELAAEEYNTGILKLVNR
ncbi:hypothetical protein ANN_21935 [Periplaneta americana]|uniref:Mos1 transposase HTH domain-containing protein n=1 Tax=Periplaneta americana TaxID=6978 RepID=A0ABQ8S6R8_PERAM|nr:hypothetical protein ANN_21935 [Periplaneta americana]